MTQRERTGLVSIEGVKGWDLRWEVDNDIVKYTQRTTKNNKRCVLISMNTYPEQRGNQKKFI